MTLKITIPLTVDFESAEVRRHFPVAVANNAMDPAQCSQWGYLHAAQHRVRLLAAPLPDGCSALRARKLAELGLRLAEVAVQLDLLADC